MSTIVHVSWMNPSERVSHYPAVLEGMNIEATIPRPADEYFFLATSEEAQELKLRMERHIRRRSYTVVDENNQPIICDGDPVLVSEPEITILDIP